MTWEDPYQWASSQSLAVGRELHEELNKTQTPLGIRELNIVTFVRKLALGDVKIRGVQERAREVMNTWSERLENP